MPSGLKPYFYFILRCGTILDSLQQVVEPVQGIRNCEHICQDITIGTDDEAIVLIFRNINANRNHHNKYLQR